ncbi:MAG: nucleoside triphosphate pyrophosphatase [Nanobdellota archaeon]
MRKVILASTSPRRKFAFEKIGIDFEVIPSNYEEDMSLNLSPEELVKKFAYGKAKDVAEKSENKIVVGIDTIVVFNGKNIGKPKDKKEAYDMLKNFSDNKVKVYSGFAIIDNKTGKEVVDFDISNLKFGTINEEEINKYIATDECMDKAGAFGVLDKAGVFIESFDGCFYNVIGIPLRSIYLVLKEMGVEFFKKVN